VPRGRHPRKDDHGRPRPHRADDRRTVGLESSAEVITLSGRELETTERTSVFARVALEQNLRLALALQAGGNVVAMIGDGVNHASALKQVEMGVAMDITGTNVTKEAADMALTDDNFASIEAAVEEGRAVFDNLTKFIVWILPINAGLALIQTPRNTAV
jgi:cation-transporting P-type ATPase F